MLLKEIKLIFFLLTPLILTSQTITCKIKNTENNYITFANILFKEEKTLRTKEFSIAENGHISYQLKKDYNSLIIEIKSIGYISKKVLVGKPLKTKHYIYNVILERDSVNLLDEVVVIGAKKPFSIKRDTITFNVSRYSNGTERKIEEIIEKLPGIDVDKNSGEIRYKGKSIETVTLDGDNLFGFNYTLGTKNINIDMVEQIEAIDNYTDNPLLKGIQQGGKVSLNLKLKKGKTDFSGDIELGIGLFEDMNQSYDLNLTLLGINKTYKSFASLSYNNVGINNTPFDYFGFSFNIEQQKELNYFAEKIIPEVRFFNLLNDRRANINNQFFGNYNAIFKLNPNLSIKTNLYYLQDKITTNQIFQNNFQINNDKFTTTDNTLITKKPQQYRCDIEVKYNTSKKTLLEYNLRLRKENIETPTKVIQNQTSEFLTFLNSEDLYFRHNLLWTKKLNDKKALQLSIFHSFNDLPQTFSITPSLFKKNVFDDIQQSKFKKTFLEGKAMFLGSGKKDKYSFTLGTNLDYSPFVSRLFNSEETISKNNFEYLQRNIFNRGIYIFNRGKWQISPSYSIRFLTQNLHQNIELDKLTQSNLIFEPALKVNYLINSISLVSSKVSLNQTTNAESFFFKIKYY